MPEMEETMEKRQAYHHGALREALIESATKLVALNGMDGFSIRDTSADLGVSVAALYRHFSDKTALLLHVADRSFSALEKQMHKAASKHEKGSEAAISAAGQAYVVFAQRNQNIFRLMFSGFYSDEEAVSADLENGYLAYAVLTEQVEQFLEQHSLEHHLQEKICLHLWSIVHGTAGLLIDQNFKRRAPDVETAGLVSEAVERYLRGVLLA